MSQVITNDFLRYTSQPFLLREEVQAATPQLVIIDEVQKVPLLLDEVHWLIENTSTVFGWSVRSRRKGRQASPPSICTVSVN